MKVYETLKDPTTGLIKLENVLYRIETNEAERIAVDHIAQSSDSENTNKRENLGTHCSGRSFGWTAERCKNVTRQNRVSSQISGGC